MRLLCVTAHPDDESGGFGGTLLRYAGKGVETHIVCLTPGQAATNRGGARTDDELAAMRRKEFAEACSILKVMQAEVLDYPDARLYRLDFYTVVEELTRRVRSICPHVVITMGPEGSITAHPDHSMVSLFATMAFHWSGRANRFPEQLKQGLRAHQADKLYFLTSDFSLPERGPVLLPPITAEVDITEFIESKIASFKAHKSQAPLFSRVEEVIRRRGCKEYYHLAAATIHASRERETDLFAGVVEKT